MCLRGQVIANYHSPGVLFSSPHLLPGLPAAVWLEMDAEECGPCDCGWCAVQLWEWLALMAQNPNPRRPPLWGRGQGHLIRAREEAASCSRAASCPGAVRVTLAPGPRRSAQTTAETHRTHSAVTDPHLHHHHHPTPPPPGEAQWTGEPRGLPVSKRAQKGGGEGVCAWRWGLAGQVLQLQRLCQQ